MKRLVHLKYCIKESLRLFPPVSVVGRVLDQDTNITGYVMPKGTSVTCSIYAIHRHPDFWENPDVRHLIHRFPASMPLHSFLMCINLEAGEPEDEAKM